MVSKLINAILLGIYSIQSMGNFPLARIERLKYLAYMEKTFAEAFVEHLSSTGARVTDIAKKSGVDKDALYSLKYGKTRDMSVRDAIKVASAFGMTVEEFLGITTPEIDDALNRKLKSLSPRERALLSASIEAFLAPQGQKS